MPGPDEHIERRFAAIEGDVKDLRTKYHIVNGTLNSLNVNVANIAKDMETQNVDIASTKQDVASTKTDVAHILRAVTYQDKEHPGLIIDMERVNRERAIIARIRWAIFVALLGGIATGLWNAVAYLIKHAK